MVPESEYDHELTWILKAASTSAQRLQFDELLRKTDGAFPSDVLSAARRLDLQIDFADHEALEVRDGPDPSPAQGEFYFDRATAKFLASALMGRVLLLGAPSVAAELTHQDRPLTLVDSSPWLNERFGITGSLRVGTVETFRAGAAFDSAVLDPPWYFPEMTTWLSIAANAVKAGGTILMPLLGRLTRPSATRDRIEILEMASRVGSVSVVENVVAYDSPHFERRAIARSGGRLGREWRRASLLKISRSDADIEPLLVRNQDPSTVWVDRRIGQSIVSIRRKNPESGTRPVVHLLDGISRRDPRIAASNVWTSESTAAVVDRPEVLLDELSQVESSWSSATRALLDRLEIDH
ncbi:MAG: hypothetical protein JWP19_1301 [Rhodoglobus sp.]|nr:hypothetical protein [Rhodoglobus sp.]